MRCRQAVLAALVAAGLVGGLPAIAAADDKPQPPIVVSAGDQLGRTDPPAIGVEVTALGHPGGPISTGQTATSGGSACAWVPAPDMEAWLRHLPARLPGGSDTDRVDPRSQLYQEVCDGLAVGWAWLGPAGVDAPVVLPSPAELAREAYGLLRLPAPSPGRSPDLRLAEGRAAVLVGEHTWIWTDPALFAARSRTVRVGPVWATVTGTPVGLSFDPGTGDPVAVCVGAGTPWVAGRYGLHQPSPTCDVVLTRSSAGLPGGVVTATWAIRWRVSWVGAVGGRQESGVLDDMTSRTPVVLAVAEAQALITG
jgi:hypothetical protein